MRKDLNPETNLIGEEAKFRHADGRSRLPEMVMFLSALLVLVSLLISII